MPASKNQNILGIEPDQLSIPFVAIFHSLSGRKVLGFRP
jgi:hypothetical protein